jgi:hypothetical protein
MRICVSMWPIQLSSTASRVVGGSTGSAKRQQSATGDNLLEPPSLELAPVEPMARWRASICSSMSGDRGVDAGDPAQHLREQDFALNARPTHFLLLYLDKLCCFTWINGVNLRYGSTADQGRTGREDSSSRLWCPARALGTHAKQGPSTGHSAVGLRQAGKISPDAEATFHRASCTLGNQVVAASDGPPFRQERRPTRLCRKESRGSGTSKVKATWPPTRSKLK